MFFCKKWRWTFLLALFFGGGLSSGECFSIPPTARGVRLRVGTQRLSLWLAVDGATKQRGLMEVRSLAPLEGMIFIYEESAQRHFWMKNVYLPLDMIFLDSTLRVTEIVENAPPQFKSIPGSGEFAVASDPFIVSTRDRDIRYVVELQGGRARRLGIREGLTFRVDGFWFNGNLHR